MTTNVQVPKTDTLYTESPVSWNTRYLTPEGFECQLTLRGDSGQEVLEKAGAAMSYLLNHGCQPASYKTSGKGSNSSSHVGGQPNSASQPEKASATNGNNGHAPNWCPIHNCDMKRWEKDGKVWFSHKADGGWCTGKSK